MFPKRAYIAQYFICFFYKERKLSWRDEDDINSFSLNALKAKKCSCPEFFYIPSYASYDFKCLCKLSFKLHDPITKKGPRCQGFKSTWTCSCGKRWEEHETVFERKRDREKGGRITNDVERMMEEMEGAENRCMEVKKGLEEKEIREKGSIEESKGINQKPDTSSLLKKTALFTLNSKILIEKLENQKHLTFQIYQNSVSDEEPSCFKLFTTPHSYRRRVWKQELN